MPAVPRWVLSAEYGYDRPVEALDWRNPAGCHVHRRAHRGRAGGHTRLEEFLPHAVGRGRSYPSCLRSLGAARGVGAGLLPPSYRRWQTAERGRPR
eukprot:scaffold203190_cov27-Tisochrysis_lutea.AAC.1